MDMHEVWEVPSVEPARALAPEGRVRERGRYTKQMRAAALAILAGAVAVAPLPADPAPTCPPAWNYTDKGPDRWATLDPSWAVCGSGKQQSPIDVPEGAIRQDNRLYLPVVDYPLMKIKVENTGNSIKVQPRGPARLRLGDTWADLVEFHFHVPAEHTVYGVREAGELHLVHRLPNGRLVVMAVLLRAGGNTENPMLQKIIDLKPDRCGESREPNDSTFDLTKLMAPNKGHYFFYDGSLTTPPCTEGVQWMVGAEALVVPARQIESLRAASGLGNARPVQLLRVVRWRPS